MKHLILSHPIISALCLWLLLLAVLTCIGCKIAKAAITSDRLEDLHNDDIWPVQ